MNQLLYTSDIQEKKMWLLIELKCIDLGKQMLHHFSMQFIFGVCNMFDCQSELLKTFFAEEICTRNSL